MTLMTRIIVGLIGINPDLISSNTIPTTDSRTIATSSWFHLPENQSTQKWKQICTFKQKKTWKRNEISI